MWTFFRSCLVKLYIVVGEDISSVDCINDKCASMIPLHVPSTPLHTGSVPFTALAVILWTVSVKSLYIIYIEFWTPILWNFLCCCFYFVRGRRINVRKSTVLYLWICMYVLASVLACVQRSATLFFVWWWCRFICLYEELSLHTAPAVKFCLAVVFKNSWHRRQRILWVTFSEKACIPLKSNLWNFPPVFLALFSNTPTTTWTDFWVPKLFTINDYRLLATGSPYDRGWQGYRPAISANYQSGVCPQQSTFDVLTWCIKWTSNASTHLRSKLRLMSHIHL